MSRFVGLALFVLSGLVVRSADARCHLANPSFEMPGSAGSRFADWDQAGLVTASSAMVAHGQMSARLYGPNRGEWSMSGIWQSLDAVRGEILEIRVRAGHHSADPLTGESRGLMKIEWLDSNGDVISEESHVVIEPSQATGVMNRIELQTNSAPVGTVAARIVLGKLQGPDNDPGSAFFDMVQFRSLTSQTVADVQWDDFPSGRTVDFAGRAWRVKGPGYMGPGPNLFANGEDYVWVDEQDRLHMTIRKVAGSWYSTEITLVEPLLYGDYIFTTVGELDTWASNVVLGLFVWHYALCSEPSNYWNLYCEFDLEISRWGVSSNDVGQFVAQPFDYPGNMERFAINYTSPDQEVSYAFRLLPDKVECRCWRGGPYDERPGTLIHSWTYVGPHIPMPEEHRVHINLWQYAGPPFDGQDHEAIISHFKFVPSCVDDADGSDWRCFETCLAGPAGAILSACGEFDRDGDGDVDLVDLAVYQRSVITP